MANGLMKNILNKYFSKMNPLKLIKASLTIIAICIYIWFFCLIAIIYDTYRESVHKLIENSSIESLVSHTVGYNQPVAVIFVIIIDKIIFNKAIMKPYVFVFGILTLLILVLLGAWFIIKSIFIISWAAYVWPFDELKEVFNIILGESPFVSFAITNLLRILKIFLSFFKKKEKFQNMFDMASIIKSQYEARRIYIKELEKNLYNKAKQHYEKKETYMVDVMKVREHTTDAIILKNLSIITSEEDIANANISDAATIFDVNIKIATKV